MKKRFLTILMSMLMVFVMMPMGTWTTYAADEGIKLVDGIYEISSYDGLKEFAAIVNGGNTSANAILTADITCTGDDWRPIGYSNNRYNGTFDGDGHIINGLSNKASGDGAASQGLFRYIGSSGKVMNVGLEGGNITGSDAVGGIASDNFGTITNCYNTGTVSCTLTTVGGVVAYNHGTITNCYNTGTISGVAFIGGVAAYNSGLGDYEGVITNCYNTGEVSGTGDIYDTVGGVAGFNRDGTITNCYNAGAVNGTGVYVGGVVGDNARGEIKFCCFDQTFNSDMAAVGHRSDGTTQYVYGFDTSDMTGTNAVHNMSFTNQDPWLTKADGKDPDTSEYYWYYPHLKGFDYDNSSEVKDWPPKVTVKAEWNGLELYTYNGSVQKPTVNKITISNGSTDVILDPGEYAVSYYVKDGDTYTAITEDIVNAGSYKAVITFKAGGHTSIEKEFVIDKAPLTITAKNQTYTYNGQIQGPGDTVYEDAAQIAELVSTVGLQGTDALSSIIVDGQRTEIGEYPITLFGAAVGNATENYAITYVDGTLTITPIPLKVTINGSSAKKVYNGKQQTYTGTVTVKSSDPAFDASKFSYKGSKDVTGTKAGVYTTRLATEGCVYNDPQYELNVSIGEPVKLTIESASLTATVNGGSTEKVYNGKEQTYEGVVKATSSDKAFDPSKFSYKGSKDVTGTDVGVYTTELNGKDCAYSDTNYEVSWTVGEPVKLTVNKADITPSVSIQGWSYGSDANKPKVEGNTGGGTEKFLYKEKDAPDTAYTEKVPTDAGAYTVKAEVAESDNYNSGSATLDFTIAPGDMQVTSSGADVDFDGSGHSITVNAPEGASVEYSQDGGKTYSTENPVYTDAGKYSVPFRVILKNYNEYEGTEQVIIRQAPNSVSVSIEGWTYGEQAHIPAVDAKFGADHASLSYSDAPDGTYKTGGPDQAGTWYVKATVPETQDYAGAESVPVAFEIAKAKLTITAKDQVFEYNRQEQGEGKEGDSAYSDSDVIAEKVTVEGLQNNDAITSVTLTGHRKTIGEYQDEIKITDFAINNDTAAKDNYDVTLKSGKLTITKHILTETKEVPATCEKDGTKAYWTCSECKKMFSDKDGENEITEPEVIKATGHDWGEWTVTKEATETEEGEEQRVCKNDPEHKEARAIPVIPASVTYSNVSGEGNIWYKGSDATSDFAFKRSVDDTSTFSHFTGIRVDNNAVDEANYSKESGSVIIKLKPEYLETLALGKHTLEVRFDDGNGSATAEFTIAEAEEENTDDEDDNGGGSKGSKKNVNTGDESLVAFWASLLGVSLIGLFMLFAARQRLRRKDR